MPDHAPRLRRIPPPSRRLLHSHDPRRCIYCRRIAPLTAEHIIPRARFARGLALGDPNAPRNLARACARCNATKRDMGPRVFAVYLEDEHGWSGEDVRAMLARLEALRCPR